MQERLQKIISRAGIASRRHAEQLILSGAVTVNGHVVTELGTKADAARDHITVGPRTVRLRDEPERYFAFHKPAQVVSTMSDPEGRPCLGPYLRGFPGRMFPVGRLEFDSAGLLLLTSDGTLASDLMRGAAVIPQAWRIKVKGRIAGDAQQQIERSAGARVRVYRDAPNAWYEAEMASALSPATAGSGSRSVSGVWSERLGNALLRASILVEKMVRTKYAGVELGNLAPGEMRELTGEEVRGLRWAVTGRMKGEIRNARFDARKPAQRSAGQGKHPAQPFARSAAEKTVERPERAGFVRAVEEWRTAHPRKTRGVRPRRERGGRSAIGRKHRA